MESIDRRSTLNIGWDGAGEEESLVHYSKRNIKCGNSDIIWARHDKPWRGATNRKEKRRGGDGFAASCDLWPIACLSSDSLLMAIGKDLNPFFCAFLKINTSASIWLNAHPLCWNEARWALSSWSMRGFYKNTLHVHGYTFVNEISNMHKNVISSIPVFKQLSINILNNFLP